MFGFVKKVFLSAIMCFGWNSSNVNPLKYVSMSNQKFKVRPEIININNNEIWLYPDSVKISTCSGGCNNINDPYAKICIADVVKNINLKVFKLMPMTNETRYIVAWNL